MDYLVWATDSELRRNGSSGGFIRAMLLYLISEGLIGKAVITHTGPENGSFHPESLATSDPEELRSRRSSSVYYPTDPLSVQLDPRLTYAVVLLPCQVEELREMQSRGKWLNVIYVFELLCSYMPSSKWTEELCKRVGVKTPQRITYRGDGWPGNLSIDGQRVPYTWPPDVRDYGLTKCQDCSRVCGRSDWICADPWGLSPKEVGEGKTLVRSHTINSKVLMEAAYHKKYIQKEPDNGLMQKRLKKHGRRRWLNLS